MRVGTKHVHRRRPRKTTREIIMKELKVNKFDPRWHLSWEGLILSHHGKGRFWPYIYY